jgi:hypothetical protein
MTLTKLSCQSSEPLANQQPALSAKLLPQQKTTQTGYHKKRPIAKMVLFGAMSLGAYSLLFSNEALVTNTYTLGGWHAVLPVGTAFAFSFMHGAFASNFLDVLGLEPKKS